MHVQFPATGGLFYVPLASLAPPDKSIDVLLAILPIFSHHWWLGSPLHILLTWFCSCCYVPSPPKDLGCILTWKCFLCPQWPLTFYCYLLLLLWFPMNLSPFSLLPCSKCPKHQPCKLMTFSRPRSASSLGDFGIVSPAVWPGCTELPPRGLQSKCISLSTSSAVWWPEATQGSSITFCIRINSFCIQSTLKGLK